MKNNFTPPSPREAGRREHARDAHRRRRRLSFCYCCVSVIFQLFFLYRAYIRAVFSEIITRVIIPDRTLCAARALSVNCFS